MNKHYNPKLNHLLNETDEGPWYKQFWAWFVIVPLLAVVTMGCTLLFFAIKGADSIVVDNYYKEGLSINQLKGADQLAVKLEIKIKLWIDDLTGEVRVQLSGQRTPDFLKLRLYHATLKDKDTQIKLTKGADSAYYGQLEQRLKDKWYLFIDEDVQQLSTSANSLEGSVNEKWRIKTMLFLPMTAALSIDAGEQ